MEALAWWAWWDCFFSDPREVPFPQVLDHLSSLQSMCMGVRRPGFKFCLYHIAIVQPTQSTLLRFNFLDKMELINVSLLGLSWE